MTPNFSARAYPWDSLRRLTRDEAIVESVVARWFAAAHATPFLRGDRLRKLLRLAAAACIAVDVASTRARATLDSRRADDPHASTRAAPSAFAPTSTALDPYAATCVVRLPGGAPAFEVLGSSIGVRALVQRMMPGPAELAAARPLGVVEQSLWALVVATALEDLGVRAQVWPLAGPSHLIAAARSVLTSAPASASAKSNVVGAAPDATSALGTEAKSSVVGADPASAKSNVVRGETTMSFDVEIDGVHVAVAIRAPRDALTRAPATAEPAEGVRTAAWLDAVRFDLTIVVGRCAIHRDDLARLGVRSVVTLERPTSGAVAELEVFSGVLGLRARSADWAGGGAAGRGVMGIGGAVAAVSGRAAGSGPGGVVGGGKTGAAGSSQALPAEVVTGYVPRDMSLPDQAHVELTVALGTTQLSLRQITELAVGQIVQLGRPLGGPFELRAAGRVLGRGELVDVDGELAVRIVSLGD